MRLPVALAWDQELEAGIYLRAEAGGIIGHDFGDDDGAASEGLLRLSLSNQDHQLVLGTLRSDHQLSGAHYVTPSEFGKQAANAACNGPSTASLRSIAGWIGKRSNSRTSKSPLPSVTVAVAVASAIHLALACYGGTKAASKPAFKESVIITVA